MRGGSLALENVLPSQMLDATAKSRRQWKMAGKRAAPLHRGSRFQVRGSSLSHLPSLQYDVFFRPRRDSVRQASGSKPSSPTILPES